MDTDVLEVEAARTLSYARGAEARSGAVGGAGVEWGACRYGGVVC